MPYLKLSENNIDLTDTLIKIGKKLFYSKVF